MVVGRAPAFAQPERAAALAELVEVMQQAREAVSFSDSGGTAGAQRGAAVQPSLAVKADEPKPRLVASLARAFRSMRSVDHPRR
jgi:hypothetical protein